MDPFTYAISLRIWHPGMEPQFITSALKLEPNRMLKVGKQRETPARQKLSGTNRETYWYTYFTPKGGTVSSDTSVEDSLSKLTTLLRPHRDFFAFCGRVAAGELLS